MAMVSIAGRAALVAGSVVLSLTLAPRGVAAAEIDPAAGRRLAETHCSECHAITPTRQRELAPTFSELAQDPASTPTSLRFLLTNPHYAMPNLKLSEDQMASIIAYILSLRDKKD
jgi:mono/diheme cytochrome c family protein